MCGGRLLHTHTHTVVRQPVQGARGPQQRHQGHVAVRPIRKPLIVAVQAIPWPAQPAQPLSLVDHVAVAVVVRRRIAEAARRAQVAREGRGLAHELVEKPALWSDGAQWKRLQGEHSNEGVGAQTMRAGSECCDEGRQG